MHAVPPLNPMPAVEIPQLELRAFGETWLKRVAYPGSKKAKPPECLSRTPPYSSAQLGELFDAYVGAALAEMCQPTRRRCKGPVLGGSRIQYGSMASVWQQ